MRRSETKVWVKIIIPGALVLAVAGLFQNCSNQLGSSSDVSSFNEGLPFAYDSTIDTLAYMSCGGGTTSANQDAIWTFRAGSYISGSGIKLSDDYFSVTSNYSPEQKAALLHESAKNRNTALQFSIREANSLQSVLAGANGAGGKEGKDFATMIGPLDNMSIAKQISALAPGARINYFPGIAGLLGKHLEGTLRFTDAENTAASVRGALSGLGLLTMTYSNDLPPDPHARGPTGVAADRAYGFGYKVSFVPGIASETEPRVLASVDEISLLTNRAETNVTRTWSCPQKYRFKIARGTGDCMPIVDVGQADGATLAIARRVLEAENWFVNVAGQCVYQKSPAQQCYPNSTSYSNFVSICVRN